MPSSDHSGVERLALRPEEAAEALGVSKGKLRSMLPRLPHVRDGNALLLPVRELREWLAAQAKVQAAAPSRADAILEEIIGSAKRRPASDRE